MQNDKDKPFVDRKRDATEISLLLNIEGEMKRE